MTFVLGLFGRPMLPTNKTGGKFAAMYSGISLKSGNNQFLLWVLALALLVSQTLAVSHIHHHPESENEAEIVSSAFTPAYTHNLPASVDHEYAHEEPAAEHDESCVLCLLFHISWLPASNISTNNLAQIHEIPITARHVFVSGPFLQSFLARAPPLFS